MRRIDGEFADNEPNAEGASPSAFFLAPHRGYTVGEPLDTSPTSTMPPLARLISLGILTVLIVALGITFYQVLAPFLLPLFLAWVTAILCRPLYLWCVAKTNGRERLAAGLTTAGLLLVVLLPLVLGTIFAAAQLIEVARETIGDREWREKVLSLLDDPRIEELAQSPWLDSYLGVIEAAPTTANSSEESPAYRPTPTGGGAGSFAEDGTDPFDEDAELAEETDEERTAREAGERQARTDRLKSRISESLRATLQYVGGRTIGIVGEIPGVALGVLGRVVSLLVGMVMFAIGLYYFLCDGPAIVEAAESLIPVRIDYQRELLRRFDEVVRAVVLSTFLSALAQGVLTTAALGVAGFDRLLVFFVLASLGAMIPLAGTWLVWGPCVLWLIWREQAYGYAAFVAIWGVLVVGTIDNVIRTYILNSSAKLHPLLAFVSVLGGLQVMGLWGVFIAPVVAACLHALMQIFNAELKAFSQERTAGREGPDVGTGEPATIPAVASPGIKAPTAKPVVAGAGQGKRRKR
jgi:predicted PurR-regulated permease PerM